MMNLITIGLGITVVGLVREVIRQYKRNSIQEKIIESNKRMEDINRTQIEILEAMLERQKMIIERQRETLEMKDNLIKQIREEFGFVFNDKEPEEPTIIIDED